MHDMHRMHRRYGMMESKETSEEVEEVIQYPPGYHEAIQDDRAQVTLVETEIVSSPLAHNIPVLNLSDNEIQSFRDKNIIN